METKEELHDAGGRLMYPAWRYKPSGEAKIVNTPTESALLGKGWYSHPDCAPEHAITIKSEAKAAVEPQSKPAETKAAVEPRVAVGAAK